jgi:hypothetical protein
MHSECFGKLRQREVKGLSPELGIAVHVCKPVIPALGRRQQEDRKLKINMIYIMRPCFKKQNKQKRTCPRPQS